jgi:hypothetical protein
MVPAAFIARRDYALRKLLVICSSTYHIFFVTKSEQGRTHVIGVTDKTINVVSHSSEQ